MRCELFEELALLHGTRPGAAVTATSTLPEGSRTFLAALGVLRTPVEDGVTWPITRFGWKVIATCAELAAERDREFLDSLAPAPERPENEKTALQRACLCADEGRIDEALELLERVEDADSFAGRRAMLLRARLLHEQGDTAAAEEIVARFGDDVRGELALDLADVYSRLGERERAGRLCEDVLAEIAPGGARESETAARRLRALAHYRLGRLAHEEGDLDAAYEHWFTAFSLKDPTASAYAARSLATKIGNRTLLPERVKELYRYAMSSDHPALAARSALEFADHLARSQLFVSARECLEPALRHPRTAARAAERLELLEAEQRGAPKLRVLDGFPELRKIGEEFRAAEEHAKRVVIVGAGEEAQDLLHDALRRSPQEYTVVGFLDEEVREIPGQPYRFLGEIGRLRGIITTEKVDEVWMAIPRARGRLRAEVVEACRNRVTLKNLPLMRELRVGWTRESEDSLVAQLRPVRYHETVGNEERPVWEATRFAAGRVALVIGVGVLGREVAHSLLHAGVERLVLVDRDRQVLNAAESWLGARVGESPFQVIFGHHAKSTNRPALAEILKRHQPSLVFHTTASAPPRFDQQDSAEVAEDALETTQAVLRSIVEHAPPDCVFVHASSVHARDPRSYVGGVRALSESLVLAHAPQLRRVVVRVPPLLDGINSIMGAIEQQALNAQPIVVPRNALPDRFVATARAAELVLHAARIGQPGELLDMDAGDEIRIESAAAEMVRLAGREPYDEVSIELADLPYERSPRLRADRPADPEVPELVVAEPFLRDPDLIAQAVARVIELAGQNRRDAIAEYLAELPAADASPAPEPSPTPENVVDIA